MSDTASALRRRAALRLVPLAAALLLAGVLPWAAGGPLAARVVSLPLALAGLGVAAVTVRVLRDPGSLAGALRAGRPGRTAGRTRAARPPGGCGGCGCGAGGCGRAGP